MILQAQAAPKGLPASHGDVLWHFWVNGIGRNDLRGRFHLAVINVLRYAYLVSTD